TTAPDAPSDVTINNNEDGSTTVTGNAEPGSTVEVRDENGDVVGTGTADEDGNFSIEVEGGLNANEDYDVVAKDEAGNESDPVTITGDETAPDAPSDVTINNNEDGSTTVTGNAEPGSTVEVRDENGDVDGTGTADEDGNFEME